MHHGIRPTGKELRVRHLQCFPLAFPNASPNICGRDSIFGLATKSQHAHVSLARAACEHPSLGRQGSNACTQSMT
eukprot:1956420-Amphidinium_carterae.1